MRRCSTCKQSKPSSEFSRWRRSKDGLSGICKTCQHGYVNRHYRKNRERYIVLNQAYKASHLAKGLCSSGCGAPLHTSNRNYCLEHAAGRGQYYAHGLQLDGRLILYARQDGACAVCGQPELDPMKLHIDHSHKTGHVRGLLCSPCNKGIGLFSENTARLHSAVRYLEERV